MKVCDICKKEIPNTPFLAARFPLVMIAITESTTSGMRTADLCADCQLRVYNFVSLDKGKKGKQEGGEQE